MKKNDAQIMCGVFNSSIIACGGNYNYMYNEPSLIKHVICIIDLIMELNVLCVYASFLVTPDDPEFTTLPPCDPYGGYGYGYACGR